MACIERKTNKADDFRTYHLRGGNLFVFIMEDYNERIF